MTRLIRLPTLQFFVATRASFVAQKKLYGYLKTRIGTRYPRVFDDELFVQSINIAKYHVFAACLSDLAIYAVATVWKDHRESPEFLSAMAMSCFERGMDDNSGDAPEEFSADKAVAEFARRLERTDWVTDAGHFENFTESPKALLKWAPIADHLKAEDAEIVQNSIKFAWRDIREQFRQRVVADAVVADSQGHANSTD